MLVSKAEVMQRHERFLLGALFQTRRYSLKAVEKLVVNRDDFLHALEYNIKPAFGTNNEAIERLISCGVTLWSPLVNELHEDGRLFMEQVKLINSSREIVSLLLEGAPNFGKSGLAARLAIDSDFPFIKLCSSDEMVGFTETAKCMTIRKVLDDAYKSSLSVILIDNIERSVALRSVQDIQITFFKP